MADRSTVTNDTSTTGENGHRSAVEVVQDALNNVQEIIRSEIALAKAEIREEAVKAGKAAGLMGAAAMTGFFGFALAIATCVAALAIIIPIWLSLLLFSICLFCVAAAFYFAGRNRMKRVRTRPEKTVQTLRDDVEWLKHQTR